LDPGTTIRGDYDSIRSVVQNLMENSLKYSKGGTAVSVHLENAPDKAVLRVKDQGIGISGADLKRIFDKFYRAGDELTRKTKGSGLGLAIVKQILDIHKAQIKANSKLNEGTEMVITFPKGDGKRRGAALPNKEPGGQGPAGPGPDGDEENNA
jgi:signal transduction histidine kinase